MTHMKKLLVSLLLTGFIAAGTGFSQATLKLGHIDSQALFTSMPESDSAQKKLEKSAQQMQTTLEQLQVEFNKKYEEYTKLTTDNTTSDLILRTKEEELQSLQQRIQTFQQQAEQDITAQRTALFKPIQEKALAAVNQVAAENGFTYIFDKAAGVLVYSAPDSQDILPLVKAKLGLK
jgi:outer membrane protein